MSVHNLGGKEYFVTDSVGLGLCNQGWIVSHVHVPTLTVVKNIKWWGTALWVAVSAILLLVSVSYFRKYRKERNNNIKNQPRSMIWSVWIYLGIFFRHNMNIIEISL